MPDAPVVPNECQWQSCNTLTGYEVVLCDQPAEFYAEGFEPGPSRLYICLPHAEVVRAIGEPVERIGQ